MHDKKLTDNEIIKALECCSKNSILQEFCDVCPNLAMGSQCMDNMVRDALDLINRQKAEIETLRQQDERRHSLLGFNE